MVRLTCWCAGLLYHLHVIVAVNTGTSVLDSAPLLDQLLERFGIGKGSSKKVAQLARAALKPASESLRTVATIKQGSHAERDLQSWVSKRVWRRLMPEPYKFKLALKSADYCTTVDEFDHYALLPHEVFYQLYKHARPLFAELFGDEESLREWWSLAEAAGDSWYTENPIIDAEPVPEKRIPYGLHGDDAGVQGKDQVWCMTWGAIAGKRKTTLDTRIAFTMAMCSKMVYPTTQHTILNVLRWSLDALSNGKFPAEDHAGVPFSKNTTHTDLNLPANR